MFDATYGGCCTFRHGKLSIWTLIFTIIAFCCSMNSTCPCFYVTVTIPSGDKFFPAGTMGFGLLSYSTQPEWAVGHESLYECTPWVSYPTARTFFDAPWKTAVAFGILGVLTTSLGLFAAITMSCMTLDRMMIQVLSAILFLASVSEASTLVAFSSDMCSTYNCTFASSARLAIGASIASFVAAILCCMTPSSRRDFTPSEATTPLLSAAEPNPGTALPVVQHKSVASDGGTRKTIVVSGIKTLEGPQMQAY